MNQKYFYILTGIVVFAIVLLSLTDDRVRNFKFSYVVNLDKSKENVEVWIPVPQSNKAQKISKLKLESGVLDCELLNEKTHNNKYYYCKASSINQPTKVVLTADVKRIEHGTLQYPEVNSKNYDKGTNNSTVFEGSFFEDVISSNDLNKNNMEGIYNYVLNGMHYGKPKKISDNDQYYAGQNPITNKEWLPNDIRYGIKKVSKEVVVSTYKKAKNDKTNYTFGNGNSKYACDIGVGNCTDYHSYFMSIARTLDVPSRFHMGFNVPNKQNEDQGKIGGYHCWADYYVDNEGWTPVDISEADKDPNKADYFFGNLDKNRVEFTVGRDLVLKGYNDPVNFFIYPLVKGTSFSKEFSYENL